MADSEQQARNIQLIEQLDADGFTLDHIHMLKFRLDVITEFLVTNGAIDGDALEQKWEAELGDLLESIAVDVRKQTLLAE